MGKTLPSTSASRTGKGAFWKSRNVLITTAVAAFALAGGATFALWPKNYDKVVSDLAKKGPEEVRKAVESGQVPREVAWEAFGQAREAEMQKRMDAYFALKTPMDRQKYLDNLINDMEKQRREWQQRASTRPARPEGERRRDGERGPTSQPSEQRLKEMQQRRAERQDKQSPVQRAQRVEFMMAMQKRMQERGIQGGFGRGPGGGFGRGPGGGRDGARGPG